IRSDLRDLGFRDMAAIKDAYVACAYDHAYHPIKDYLGGLVWNGRPNIATLAASFTDKHDQVYDRVSSETTSLFGLYLRRWLVGAVAKVYAGAQNPALVIVGPQDLGKSTFVRWLTEGIGTAYL